MQSSVRDILSGRHHFSCLPRLHSHDDLTGFICHFFPPSLRSLKSFHFPSVPHIFSHFTFYHVCRPFCTLALSRLSSLLIYLEPRGSRSPVSSDGAVWFSSHIVENMESKSGHTWSLGGVSFLQGLRDISWTQRPDSALPLITSLAGTAWTRAALAWCRAEFSFQAVKQLVIRWGNIQPGPPQWERLRSLLCYRFVERTTQPIGRLHKLSVMPCGFVGGLEWRDQNRIFCRKVWISSSSAPKLNTTRLLLVPSVQNLLPVTNFHQQCESCTTTSIYTHTHTHTNDAGQSRHAFEKVEQRVTNLESHLHHLHPDCKRSSLTSWQRSCRPLCSWCNETVRG